MLLNSHLIKQHRQQNGWTQSQLAQMCDVSTRTIQRAEKDGNASMETTSALAAVFAIDRESLLAANGIHQVQQTVSVKKAVWFVGFAFVLGVLFGHIL